MISDPIRLGIVGLGRAFVLMLPSFRADNRIHLVAAAAPRPESRATFEAEFGGKGYEQVEKLCADPDVEAVYIATPHQLHAEHAEIAARAGKHILIDKPLAVSMQDGARIVEVAKECGVQVIVGPSHSFDAPVALARRMIESREFGRLRMIQAMNYTDFLYRPRRPEELRTSEGGGVLFSQAVHQIDTVRLLAGGMATSVSAMIGNWDPDRATEGAFSALIGFQDGCFATLTYSGYAHFDSDIWMNNVGELGQDKTGSYGTARRALQKLTADTETALKSQRTYGGGNVPPEAVHHEHFGPIIAMCDHGDLQLLPDGVEVWGDLERSFVPAPRNAVPRFGVTDALWGAVREGRAPAQFAAWGLASLEICHAILASAERGANVPLTQQVPSPDMKEGR